MSSNRPLRLLLAVLAAIVLLAAACGDDTATEDADSAESSDDGGTGLEGDLMGTFELDAGMCDDAGTVSGSWFRMAEVGGTVDAGPFIPNADSACVDPTYTLLSPGADGGLVSGDYQPAPDPAFDDAGAALAGAIMEPVPFFGLAFGAATNPTDDSGDLPAPLITATGGTLSGDVSALAAYYGGEVFNQGAPKPGGSEPGPTGTIDAETGDFVLEWSSVISGGAFNDFTGVWHFEGTFATG